MQNLQILLHQILSTYFLLFSWVKHITHHMLYKYGYYTRRSQDFDFVEDFTTNDFERGAFTRL